MTSVFSSLSKNVGKIRLRVKDYLLNKVWSLLIQATINHGVLAVLFFCRGTDSSAEANKCQAQNKKSTTSSAFQHVEYLASECGH